MPVVAGLNQLSFLATGSGDLPGTLKTLDLVCSLVFGHSPRGHPMVAAHDPAETPGFGFSALGRPALLARLGLPRHVGAARPAAHLAGGEGARAAGAGV